MPPELADAKTSSVFGPSDFADATGASPEAMEELGRYRDLLETANSQMNLVGPSALADFWLRHAYDSAQLLSFAPKARVWADLGTGAGFPGVVIAILLKRTPRAAVHLIDSLAKRTRFLASVVSTLDLPAVVHTARAETTPSPAGLEIVTARACAPLARLLEYAQPHLQTGATALFLKGRTAEQELAEARQRWAFKAAVHPSCSDASGCIVEIWGLARA